MLHFIIETNLVDNNSELPFKAIYSSSDSNVNQNIFI